MATSVEVIYDAFLTKMLDDEWDEWEEVDLREDLYSLLQSALPYFKFPRVSLVHDETEFEADLNNEEIQIIATYMKCEWLNRTILTWENVKPLYEERDFSQANLIDKFNAMLKAEKRNGEKLESFYYRSINNKPFDYTSLAGK